MNLFDTDICWVYITDDGHQRRILFCTDDERDAQLRPRLERGERLVYRRRFDNTFDALAHKLMLQSLSASTIDCLIRRYRKLTSETGGEWPRGLRGPQV